MKTEDIDHVRSANACNLHDFFILNECFFRFFFFIFYAGVDFSCTDVIRTKKFSHHQQVFSYWKILTKSYVLVHTLQQFTFSCCSIWTIFIHLTRYEFYNITQCTVKNTKFQQIKLLHVSRLTTSLYYSRGNLIDFFFAWFLPYTNFKISPNLLQIKALWNRKKTISKQKFELIKSFKLTIDKKININLQK